MWITNVRLIGALSGGIESECGAVRVTDKTITEVSAEPVIPEAGEEVFDGKGRTLTPGLIDLHTHITGLRTYSPSDTKSPMKLLCDAAEQATLYLDYGFTTIRDCGSVGRAANFVRSMQQSGTVCAPHIISCGLILSPTEIKEADSIYEMYAFGDGADEFRKMSRRELAEEGDFVKIMASGAAFHPQGVPKEPIIADDELHEAVRTAERKGSYVAAHAHADGAIRACVEAGVRTIEHATYLSEETLSILEKTENCYLIPTLSAMFVSGSDETGFWHQRLGAMLDAAAENIARAYRAGLPIGFGTDSAAGMTQYREGIEFAYRKEKCGMKDVDILLQATGISADIAGVKTGWLKPDYPADLVLWDGRPDEDIMALADRPAAVWLDGKKVR